METLGVITGVWSLLSAPFFSYGTVMGIKGYWEGPPQVPYDTNVRVHFGASAGADIGQMGGNSPGVALFAEDGTRIGETHGNQKIWSEGSFVDVMVKAKSHQDNRKAAYLAISDGGTDGICIAAIEISHPDSSKSSISGDMIMGCKNRDVRSYYSNRKFGNNYRPNCFWLDRDGSSGIRYQGMSIHLSDIGATDARVKQYNDRIETWCSSDPRYMMHEKMRSESNIPIFWPKLEYHPDGTDVDFNKILHPTTIMSGTKPRKVRNVVSIDESVGGNGTFDERPVNLQTVGEDIGEDIDEAEEINEPVDEAKEVEEPADETVEAIPRTRRLNRRGPAAPRHTHRQVDSSFYIRSKHPEHSAAQLCHSPLSLGPSFTNIEEGLHCEMETKTLYPLCAEGVMEECFDNEANEIRELVEMPEVEAEAGETEAGETEAEADGEGLKRRAAPAPRVIKKYAHVEDWD